MKFENLIHKAILKLKNNDFKNSRELLFSGLKIEPNNIELNFLIGTSYLLEKNIKDAKKIFLLLHEKDSKNLDIKNSLAICFKEESNFLEAEKLFLEINNHQNSSSSNFNLGNLYYKFNELNKAEEFYKKSILKDNNLDANMNLAFLYYDKKLYSSALKILLKIENQVESAKKIPVNLFIGKIYKSFNLLNKSKFYFEKIIESDPKNLNAFEELFSLLVKEKKYDEALQKVSMGYNNTKEYIFLFYKARIFFLKDNFFLAVYFLEKFLKKDSENLEALFFRTALFPSTYLTNLEIDKVLKYHDKNLDALIDKIESPNFLKKYNQKELLRIVSNCSNYLLPYTGRNIKNYQEKYSKVLSIISQNIKVNKFSSLKNKKIRVGFISYFLRDHTIMRLFYNYIKKLNKDIFEIFIYDPDPNLENDHIKNNLQTEFKYIQNEDMFEIINNITSDNLDFLLFFDHGMSAQLQVLPCLRLAKKQILTWGHPITSGKTKIDFFLTNKFMEKYDCQNDYFEKLFVFNSLGIDYFFDDLKKFNVQKKIFNFDFLCIQNLSKICPNDDILFEKIFKVSNQATIFFIEHKNDISTKKFITRLKKNEILNEKIKNNKIIFLKRCDRNSFYKYINNSDILLDIPSWSGGNTTFETIYFEKPVITKRGDCLRKNHTSGIFDYLNLNELVANTYEDYIGIIKKFSNENYREIINKKIAFAKEKLFKENNCILEFENFLKINTNSN